MEPTSRSSLPGWAYVVLVALAAFLGGWLGLHLGESFGYALARFADRDIAELKDVLIWCIVLGAAVCAVASVWFLLWVVSARIWARRSALAALAFVTVGAATVIWAAYPPLKTSGDPVIDYELRLPAGLALPNHNDIDLVIWSGKSGQGCFIREIRMAGDRPEIAGNMVLRTTNLAPTVSLSLYRAMEGGWRLPIKPDAALEKNFGPWQRIEFSPATGARPLPAGVYEIRYRVRSYL